MSVFSVRLGVVGAILLILAGQSWARPILTLLARTSRRRQRGLERRKQRALDACKHPHTTLSGLAAAQLMSLLFAVLGGAFMLAAALSPSLDSKIFAATMSMTGFALMTLSLARVGHWEMVIADMEGIERLELGLRYGHIPANDP
jgi:hypothetical protein